MADMINQPPHYVACRPQVEPIALTEHLGFNLGNAIKYISRAGKKDGNAYEQDIGKAIFYLEREVARFADGTVRKVSPSYANPAAFCYWYWLIHQHPFLEPLLVLRADPVARTCGERRVNYTIHWSRSSVERVVQALTEKLKENANA